MAIELGGQAVNATPTTTSTTHQATLTLEAGDIAIVMVANRDGGNTCDSVVGSVNGAFTQAGSEQFSSTITARASIWRKENCSAGSETVTVTFSGSVRAGINLSRWTGGALSSALDQNNGANNASGTSHNCGNIDTAGAGVIVSVYISSADEGGVTQTGFTAMTVSGSGAFQRDYFGYRTITGAESNDGAMTTVNSVGSAGKIANFLEASGITDGPKLHLVRSNLRLN